MRRALALALLVALSACKIADTHFIGPGGDDAQPSDGLHDTPGIDGMTGNSSKIYVADSGGIYRFARDVATGGLTYVGQAAPLPTLATAIDGTGTHLYGVDVTSETLHTYTINSDGTLAASPVTTPLQTCTPGFAALHPLGAYLAIGCGANSGHVMTAQLLNGGVIGTVTAYANGASPRHVAFSPGGNCLFAADESGSSFSQVLAYHADATGSLQYIGAGPGPGTPRGIAAITGMLFVAGSGSLLVYTYSEASCTPSVMTNTYPVGADPQQIVIDPTGKLVLVLGNEIYSYTINGNTLTQNNGPYLSNTTQPITAGAIDVAQPHILYFTRQNGGGVSVAAVDAQGAVTLTTSVLAPLNNPTWLQLAP